MFWSHHLSLDEFLCCPETSKDFRALKNCEIFGREVLDFMSIGLYFFTAVFLLEFGRELATKNERINVIKEFKRK